MSDSEWEYEYDETETEDVWVVLDMTAHIPASVTGKGASGTGAGSGKKHSNKALGSSKAGAGEEAQTSPAVEETMIEEAQNQLQIVDLHSKNPIIAYRGALYSCHWATDLGTSIFLGPPTPTPSAAHPALRSTRSFHVLGTSSARLMAVPASLRPRLAPVESADLALPQRGDIVTRTAEGDTVHHTAKAGLRIELPVGASASKVSQARFLERLAAIKLRKGEKDQVPVAPIGKYSKPRGWEKERNTWIQKETSRGERHQQEAAVRDEARAAGSRKRRRISESSEDGEDDVEEADEGQDDDDEDGQDETDEREESEPVRGTTGRRKRREGTRHGGPGTTRPARQAIGATKNVMDGRRKPGRPRKIRMQSEEQDQDTGMAGTSVGPTRSGSGAATASVLPQSMASSPVDGNEDHDDDEDNDDDDDGMEDQDPQRDLGTPASEQDVDDEY